VSIPLSSPWYGHLYINYSSTEKSSYHQQKGAYMERELCPLYTYTLFPTSHLGFLVQPTILIENIEKEKSLEKARKSNNLL
jgi:hypothetical protein